MMENLGSYTCLTTFSTQPHHIALYLQSIGDNLKSVSAAEVNALAWVHGLAGLQSSTGNPTVQETLSKA